MASKKLKSSEEDSCAEDGSEIETSDGEVSGTSSSTSTNAEVKKKKPKSKRCGACKKRLSVVNEYMCRCGKWFCSMHRYPESHKCEFDYKELGRKMISKANPVVVAQKIQKI